MIYTNIMEYVDRHETDFQTRGLYMTSGGFDPLHIGHLRCIQETVKMASDPTKWPVQMLPHVVILVNDDEFLIKKKGYAFMPLEERMEIIQGVAPNAHIIPWFQTGDDSTVIDALRLLKPTFFTKGGDRFDFTTIPEWPVCQEINCNIITGVGGGKIQSSSELVIKSNQIKREDK